MKITAEQTQDLRPSTRRLHGGSEHLRRPRCVVNRGLPLSRRFRSTDAVVDFLSVEPSLLAAAHQQTVSHVVPTVTAVHLQLRAWETSAWPVNVCCGISRLAGGRAGDGAGR